MINDELKQLVRDVVLNDRGRIFNITYAEADAWKSGGDISDELKQERSDLINTIISKSQKMTRMILECPYDIDEVAEQAGISPRSLFNEVRISDTEMEEFMRRLHKRGKSRHDIEDITGMGQFAIDAALSGRAITLYDI